MAGLADLLSVSKYAVRLLHSDTGRSTSKVANDGSGHSVRVRQNGKLPFSSIWC